jgi:glucose-6-phosphate isomerase
MIQFKSSQKIQKKTALLARAALEKVLNRKDLGFHQLPLRDEIWSASEKMANELHARGDDLVVLGMGGSALGGRCITSTLGDRARVKYLYNSDPISFEHILADRTRLRQAQFLLISKSGNTLEINCMLDVLQTRLKELGRDVKMAVSVISEPGSNPLWSWAEKNDVWREAHPTDVGGRFSALTPVGLVPAAFARVKLDELREGAKAALKNRKLTEALSAFYFESFKRRENISVFWFYLESLNHFGPWLEQLWAESLGKKIKGKIAAASTPLILSGTGDQHSVLQQLMEDTIKRSICFVRTSEHETMGPPLSGDGLQGFEYLKGQNLGHVFAVQSKSTEEALRKTKRTTASLEISRVDAHTLGELLLTFELVIGTLGEMLGINAFNQPGVEIGKKITKTKLQKKN